MFGASGKRRRRPIVDLARMQLMLRSSRSKRSTNSGFSEPASRGCDGDWRIYYMCSTMRDAMNNSARAMQDRTSHTRSYSGSARCELEEQLQMGWVADLYQTLL